MKHIFIFGTLLVMAFLCGTYCLEGREIKYSKRIGEDTFIIPRKIVVYDKEVLVLDEGDATIRYFQVGNAEKISQFGGTGEGPGEFIQAVDLVVYKNKIYVLDDMRRKLNVYDRESKKPLPFIRYESNLRNTQPYHITVTDDGTFFYYRSTGIKGQHVIWLWDKNFKVVKGFHKTIPLYNNMNEVGRGGTTVKTYLNLAYFEYFNNKLYITYWLLNNVQEFSLEGKLLNEYKLPLASIDKTVKIVRYKSTDMKTIDRRLNYDMFSDENSLHVLSRDVNGDSVVYRLEKEGFVEAYRVKETLMCADIANNIMYASDENKEGIFIYNLK